MMNVTGDGIKAALINLAHLRTAVSVMTLSCASRSPDVSLKLDDDASKLLSKLPRG